MSKLEDLVPPLELCKQIPAGAFADSALVWLRESGNSGRFYLAERNNYLDRGKQIPAPTLREILSQLMESGDPVIVTEWRHTQKHVPAKRNGEELAVNAETAALRLALPSINDPSRLHASTTPGAGPGTKTGDLTKNGETEK